VESTIALNRDKARQTRCLLVAALQFDDLFAATPPASKIQPQPQRIALGVLPGKAAETRYVGFRAMSVGQKRWPRRRVES
jgi:hypothetical protein